jgi:alpha-mannosidase
MTGPAWEARTTCPVAVADGKGGTFPAEQSGISVSRKGVLVTAFGPNPDGAGTILRLWEQAGISGEVTVGPPGNFVSATPVNLRGEPLGEPTELKNGKIALRLGKYAPASFILN